MKTCSNIFLLFVSLIEMVSYVSLRDVNYLMSGLWYGYISF